MSLLKAHIVSIPSYGICFFNIHILWYSTDTDSRFQFRLTEFAFLTKKSVDKTEKSSVSIPSYGICFFNIWCQWGRNGAYILVSIPSYGICFFNGGFINGKNFWWCVSIPSYGICFFNSCCCCLTNSNNKFQFRLTEFAFLTMIKYAEMQMGKGFQFRLTEFAFLTWMSYGV